MTTVGQLPWAYVEPDGTTYQAVGKDGTPKVYESGPRTGDPIMLPRYRIRPDRHDEAMRYFDDWLAFQAKILPGGQASMHGYSINLDESRPHIQLLSDPFGSNVYGKNPDALKNGFSRAFGRHPRDRKVQARSETGADLFNRDGSPKMVGEGASRKMERYHAELREFMTSLGYEVESERDELRHSRHLSLADFKEVEHARIEVADQVVQIADQAALVGEKFAEVEVLADQNTVAYSAITADAYGEVAANTQEMRQRLAAGVAELPALRTQAREAGRAEGAAQAQPDRDEAAEERRRAAEELAQAATARRAAEKAQEEVQTRLASIPEYDPKLAQREMNAALASALSGAKRSDGTSLLELGHALAAKTYAARGKTVPTETVGERSDRLKTALGAGQRDVKATNEQIVAQGRTQSKTQELGE
ncbi:hypothetical protein [Rhodococcus sp. 27YEA15]|uniref:hypothetical protein n=1 Tax=Rhodococcus sp. 27YEA15 TaxID=3156259 RepID=UPI003C799D40